MFNKKIQSYVTKKSRNINRLHRKRSRNRKLRNGKIAKVSLATNDYYTNAKGERVEETQWHNLVVNGKLADIMEKYVHKGKEISVEGKLMYRSYDDKDGNKRFITEIRVDELLLLGNKNV